MDFDDGRLGDDEAPIVSSQARHLWEALSTAYQVLGLDRACGGDEVFTALVLARVIEPTSKLDSIRVLTELGIAARRIPRSSGGCRSMRHRAVAACARRSVRGACRAGPGDVGALRRHHVVLRDR